MSAGDAEAIAGVLLANGRQVFVSGVSSDLGEGTRVAVRYEEREHEGTVSVAPRLIIWCDPEAPLGAFLRIVAAPPPRPAIETAPPLVQFPADQDAPEPSRLAELLHLARVETHRLND